MSLIAWEKLTKAKKDGGLDFRDIQVFNDTMLEKQNWRLIDDPNCLLARVLKGNYCTSTDLWTCFVPSSASHGWKGIIIGRDLLAKHMGWAVGNGEEVMVWKDQWLSPHHQKSPMGPVEEKFSSLKVKDLFHFNSTEWNRTLIQEILPLYEHDILSLKPSKKGGPDKRNGLKHKSGKYNTKKGYMSVFEEKRPSQLTNS